MPGPEAGTAATPARVPPLVNSGASAEPAIDAGTMALHDGKHEAAGVVKLHGAVAVRPSLPGTSPEALLARASTRHADARDNAGPHEARSVFWAFMGPAGRGGAPSAALATAIVCDFGWLDGLWEACEAANARFGKGLGLALAGPQRAPCRRDDARWRRAPHGRGPAPRHTTSRQGSPQARLVSARPQGEGARSPGLVGGLRRGCRLRPVSGGERPMSARASGLAQSKSPM